MKSDVCEAKGSTDNKDEVAVVTGYTVREIGVSSRAVEIVHKALDGGEQNVSGVKPE